MKYQSPELVINNKFHECAELNKRSFFSELVNNYRDYLKFSLGPFKTNLKLPCPLSFDFSDDLNPEFIRKKKISKIYEYTIFIDKKGKRKKNLNRINTYDNLGRLIYVENETSQRIEYDSVHKDLIKSKVYLNKDKSIYHSEKVIYDSLGNIKGNPPYVFIIYCNNLILYGRQNLYEDTNVYIGYKGYKEYKLFIWNEKDRILHFYNLNEDNTNIYYYGFYEFDSNLNLIKEWEDWGEIEVEKKYFYNNQLLCKISKCKYNYGTIDSEETIFKYNKDDNLISKNTKINNYVGLDSYGRNYFYNDKGLRTRLEICNNYDLKDNCSHKKIIEYEYCFYK